MIVGVIINTITIIIYRLTYLYLIVLI